MRCLRETDGSVGLVGSLLLCFILKQVLASCGSGCPETQDSPLDSASKIGIIVTGFMPF